MENRSLDKTGDQTEVEHLCLLESGEPSIASEEEAELTLNDETDPIVSENDSTSLDDVQDFGIGKIMF